MRRTLKLLLLIGIGFALRRTGDGDGPTNRSGNGEGPNTPSQKSPSGKINTNQGTESASQAVQAEAELGRASRTDTSSTPDRPLDGPARNRDLLPPQPKRHELNRITPKSHAQKTNSVVEPSVDMKADIEAIQNGEATWKPETNEYEIHGRTYKVEDTGKEGLRTYPTGGEGVHNLNQLEYRLLQSMIKNNGDVDAAWQQNYRNPNVTDERWNAALEAFKHHKSYQG